MSSVVRGNDTTGQGSYSEMPKRAEVIQRVGMIFVYAGTVVGSIGIFFWIRVLGE